MENVIETYELPYDPEVPVVVMDEQPVQLFNEVRKPITATRHHARRVDYEYARAGVANTPNICTACWLNCSAAGVALPFVNFCTYKIREKSTGLMRYGYCSNRPCQFIRPDAEKVILVCDNLL